MKHEFYINKNSILNILKIELIEDTPYQYKKFYEAIQNADITFSMKNIDTNILKVSKSPATIFPIKDEGCEERYVICYEWKQRDVKDTGVFEGWFEIKFKNDIKQKGVIYPEGNLIVPIKEKLLVYIR